MCTVLSYETCGNLLHGNRKLIQISFRSTDSISGHVAALDLRAALSQQQEDPVKFWGQPFLEQDSPSAKWVDQRIEAGRKHFYTNMSFQTSDVLLITIHMPTPAKEGPRHSSPSSGQDCELLEYRYAPSPPARKVPRKHSSPFKKQTQRAGDS